MKPIVINLDSRPDRLKRFTKEIKALGIKTFDRFPAISQPDPLRGNGRSHYQCLKAGYRMIFEDDAFFIPGAVDILAKAKKQLPKDWDLLYLGGNVEEPLKSHSENLFRCTAAWGSYAIIYSDKGAERVLNEYDPFTGRFEIFDVYLRRNSNIDLQAYIVSPIICWTYAGYSDVNNREENYLPKMQQNEKDFMR